LPAVPGRRGGVMTERSCKEGMRRRDAEATLESNVNKELHHFSDRLLQVVEGRWVMKMKIENRCRNGAGTVQFCGDVGRGSAF